MKKNEVSLINNFITSKHYQSIGYHYRGSFIDRPLAIVLILILSPCFILNTLLALSTPQNIFTLQYKSDALGRKLALHTFSCGIWVKTAVLFDICLGSIGFCGIPYSQRDPSDIQNLLMKQIKIKAGIFSLYNLHLQTGLTITSKEQLLEQQLNGTFSDYLALIIKSFLCIVLYGESKHVAKNVKILPLFGLKVNNTSMAETVDWITNKQTKKNRTKIAFFVNAHSINLSISNIKFCDQLTEADALFADGSGMRLAAKKAGYLLKDNNNGTDMLPHLCTRCIKNGQSIYLLGALPGVAQKAANELINKFPGLNIAGTEHGYTDMSHSEKIIEAINNSGCDVLLVAMGSPIQEKWLLEHREQLQCKTALAVGGLFDFYSGEISRAPMCLRELGMEWIWRLIQEPRNKFSRYVIGPPLFLYRTFFLGLVNSGVK